MLDQALLVPVVFVVLAVFYFSQRRSSFRLPGPRGLPIVGNAFQMPRDREWLRYAEWGARYGPIFFLRLFKQKVFVINSARVAFDILDKHSSKSADRPEAQLMVRELVGWEHGMAFTRAGPRLREYRKLLNASLSPSAARKLIPLQQSAALRLVKLLLDSPERLRDHVRTCVGGNTVDFVFGEEVSSPNFDYIALADDAHYKFGLAATPYRYVVDYFPPLKYVPEWFPGAAFKRQARQWRAELDHLVQTPYKIVKERAARGIASPSYVMNCIGNSSTDELSDAMDHTIMWTAASLYTGGADTTIAGTLTFFYAMALYPEVQRKGREEILRNIGVGRLPTMDDKPSLPYIEAVVKEVLRWNSIAPIGLAHRTTDTIVYENYEIPSGSTIIANIWGMMHDETVYKDPYRFAPERFLGPNPERDPTTTAFGFGRRVCPGLHVALHSLFLNIAYVLATLSVESDGDLSTVEYTSGVISGPGPFKCRIRPYNETARELIVRE